MIRDVPSVDKDDYDQHGCPWTKRAGYPVPGKGRSPPRDAPSAGMVSPRDPWGNPVDPKKFVDAGPATCLKTVCVGVGV